MDSRDAGSEKRSFNGHKKRCRKQSTCQFRVQPIRNLKSGAAASPYVTKIEVVMQVPHLQMHSSSPSMVRISTKAAPALDPCDGIGNECKAA